MQKRNKYLFRPVIIKITDLSISLFYSMPALRSGQRLRPEGTLVHPGVGAAPSAHLRALRGH